MIRPLLGRIKGMRLWGLSIPSEGPLLFFPAASSRFIQIAIRATNRSAGNKKMEFGARADNSGSSIQKGRNLQAVCVAGGTGRKTGMRASRRMSDSHRCCLRLLLALSCGSRELRRAWRAQKTTPAYYVSYYAALYSDVWKAE
jgi:hypothetical protein